MKNLTENSQSDFIRGLVEELRPIRGRAPLRAFGTWGVASVALTLFAASRVGFRHDLATWLSQPLPLSSESFLLLFSLVCGWAAFQSGIPGKKPHQTLSRPLLLLGLALVIPWVFQVFHEAKDVPITTGFGLQGLPCSITVAALSLLPGLALFSWIRFRYAATMPRKTGRFVGLASAALGAWAIAWHCPSPEAVHILVWHLGPLLLLSWIGSRVGQALLKF